MLSPDGRWLAYDSEESGRDEIYVRPFPDVHRARWQVSIDGGSSPIWPPDGSELYYREGGPPLRLMVVAVKTTPKIVTGTPKHLFDVSTYTSFDISPDGDRFLMVRPMVDTSGTRPVVVVENWIDELERLVPTR